MKHEIALMVVLAPAIATAILGLAIELLPRISSKLHAVMHSASDVEFILHITMHSAYYGTAMGTVLGLKHDDHNTALLAGVWFVALMYFSKILSSRLEELEKKAASDLHRRTAGTTRSIVRGEMAKAALLKGDWSD